MTFTTSPRHIHLRSARTLAINANHTFTFQRPARRFYLMINKPKELNYWFSMLCEITGTEIVP